MHTMQILIGSQGNVLQNIIVFLTSSDVHASQKDQNSYTNLIQGFSYNTTLKFIVILVFKYITLSGYK